MKTKIFTGFIAVGLSIFILTSCNNSDNSKPTDNETVNQFIGQWENIAAPYSSDCERGCPIKLNVYKDGNLFIIELTKLGEQPNIFKTTLGNIVVQNTATYEDGSLVCESGKWEKINFDASTGHLFLDNHEFSKITEGEEEEDNSFEVKYFIGNWQTRSGDKYLNIFSNNGTDIEFSGNVFIDINNGLPIIIPDGAKTRLYKYKGGDSYTAEMPGCKYGIGYFPKTDKLYIVLLDVELFRNQ